MDESEKDSFEEIDDDAGFDVELEDLTLDNPRDSPDSFVQVDAKSGVESVANSETEEECEDWILPDIESHPDTSGSDAVNFLAIMFIVKKYFTGCQQQIRKFGTTL